MTLYQIFSMQLAACKLARCLMRAASQVTDHLTIEDTVIQEDLTDTYLGTIHACFNLGFEVSHMPLSSHGGTLAVSALI